MSETIKTHLENKIRHNRKLFERWQGADARMAELTVSHSQLSILITSSEKPGNLLLYCFPRHISGPVAWQNVNLELDVVSLDEGVYGVRIRDKEARLEILAEEFQVSENVKKWWSS